MMMITSWSLIKTIKVVKFKLFLEESPQACLQAGTSTPKMTSSQMQLLACKVSFVTTLFEF